MPARSLLVHVDSLCKTIDAVPVSPSRLGERLLHWDIDRREQIALQNPAYAAEEAARQRPDGTVVLSSTDEGLTLAGWIAHNAHGDELAPPGLIDRIARIAREVRLTRVTSSILEVAERAARGWTDSDLWNLNYSLAQRTGEQLRALADAAHGWPDSRYPTFEDWQDALRTNGEALLAYARQDHVDELTDIWHALPDGPERQNALEAIRVRETDLTQAAADAWRWVADNLDSLWD